MADCTHSVLARVANAHHRFFHPGLDSSTTAIGPEPPVVVRMPCVAMRGSSKCDVSVHMAAVPIENTDVQTMTRARRCSSDSGRTAIVMTKLKLSLGVRGLARGVS